MRNKRYRPRGYVLRGNILAAWHAAHDEDHAAGASWYADARHLAAELDSENIRRAAGIIAATSPRISWSGNVAMVRAIYLAGDASPVHMSDPRAKVARILGGADPLDILGGNKVRSFYRNIIGDESAVTIDRHAYHIARGGKRDYDAVGSAELARVGVYEAYADAYRAVAAEIGITPSHLQAVTWCAWRAGRRP